MAVLHWQRTGWDMVYVARLGPYQLRVWCDLSAPRERPWAWQLAGPTEGRGWAPTLEEAMQQASLAMHAYVYRAQGGRTPERLAGPMTIPEAEAYIQQRATDKHGNVIEGLGADLYIADHEGRALED